MRVVCSLKVELLGLRCAVSCSAGEEAEWTHERGADAEGRLGQPAARAANGAACAAPRGAERAVVLAPCGWCGSAGRCRCLEALLPAPSLGSARGPGRPACCSEDSADLAERSTELESVTSQPGGSAGEEDEPAAWAPSGSAARSSSAPPVDVSGRWVLSRVEGDFDGLMADAGVSWATRRLAKSFNYGAGLVSQTIEQEGDSVVIMFQNGPGQGENMMRLAVGGGRQSTDNEDGTRVEVEPVWRGEALLIPGQNADGSTMQTTRRFLSDQELVCESITSKGCVVRRYFARG